MTDWHNENNKGELQNMSCSYQGNWAVFSERESPIKYFEKRQPVKSATDLQFNSAVFPERETVAKKRQNGLEKWPCPSGESPIFRQYSSVTVLVTSVKFINCISVSFAAVPSLRISSTRPLLFSSPGLKVHVSYCHHIASAVGVCRQ